MVPLKYRVGDLVTINLRGHAWVDSVGQVISIMYRVDVPDGSPGCNQYVVEIDGIRVQVLEMHLLPATSMPANMKDDRHLEAM